MQCSNCEAEVSEDVTTCHNCGAVFEEEIDSSPPPPIGKLIWGVTMVLAGLALLGLVIDRFFGAVASNHLIISVLFIVLWAIALTGIYTSTSSGIKIAIGVYTIAGAVTLLTTIRLFIAPVVLFESPLLAVVDPFSPILFAFYLGPYIHLIGALLTFGGAAALWMWKDELTNVR